MRGGKNKRAARGIWTPDLLITSQLLYQLSYGGMWLHSAPVRMHRDWT